MSQLFWFLQTGRVYNAPDTFYSGVRELPGAHYLLVEDGKVGEPVRWWDVDVERARATYNYNDVEGEFRRLLRDAVGLRLRSDVPVGTCLSGGLELQHNRRAGDRRTQRRADEQLLGGLSGQGTG